MNFNPETLVVVGVIAFLVLGPNRLPQAARSLGRFAAELRRMSSGFEQEVRGALSEPTDALRSAMGDLRPLDVRRSVRDAISTTLTPPAWSQPTAGPPDAASGMPLSPDDPSLN